MSMILRSLLIGLLAYAAPVASQRLESTPQSLPGVWAGQASWSDYDNDGDPDLAIIGEMVDENGACVRVARIYRNDGSLLFQDLSQVQLVGVYHGDVAWGDYDNDGDRDLAIAGWDVQNDESLRLYVNDDGASGPTERILNIDRTQIDDGGSSTLRGVRYATVEWGDADNDGDLDLLVLGMEGNGTSLTRLYMNTGGLFEQDQVNSENLVNVHNGDADWGDYDNDGDLDLVIAGNNVTTSGGLGSVTEFYKNEPVGSLTLDATVSVSTPIKGGSVAWGDYDGDGNSDLALSGRDNFWNAIFQIYRNRPTGVFNLDESFSLPTTRRVAGHLAWVDYDNDGDLDLAASGLSILSVYQAFVFRNDGGQVTGASDETNLAGLVGGATAWADYDGDGKADLLLAGVDADGQRASTLYSNVGTTVTNQAPSPPQILNPATVTSESVLFSWGPGSDAESSTLTYNLRVGSVSGGNDIVSGEIPLEIGNAGFKTTKVLQRPLAQDQYFWSVQTIDGALARSEWSQEDILNVQQFVSSNQILRSLQSSAMDWGDYDNDGDLDLAITGQNRSGEAQSLIYENSAAGLSIKSDANIQPLQGGDAAWGDADNDGDLDLVVLGEDSFENRGGALYRADLDGGEWSFSVGSELQSLSSSSADWGDVDNDGDLDLAVLGQSDDVIDGVLQSYTRVLINDGRGNLADGNFGLEGLNNGELAFADMDGDGDLDLAANGGTIGGERRFLLLRNESGSLSTVDQALVALESSDLAWGDLDGDGDMDLAVGGIAETGVTSSIYTNDGNGEFTPLDGVQLTGMQRGDIVWGDYDNDQDPDLVLAGNNGAAPFLQLYENTDSGFEAETILVFTGVDFSALALVDHDGDGDIDLFSAGRDAGFSPKSTVNDNLESQFNRNRNPQVPAIVGALDSGNTVRLTWERAVDDNDSTPQGLTYNVRVGTSPDANDILSGSQAIGPGSAGNNLFQDLNGLPSGTYYWSVQAVDDGWARSDWSAADSFIIDTVAPTIAGVNLSKDQVGIGQTLTLALQILDEHSGLDPAVPPQVTAAIGDSVVGFQQLQFTGDSWTGELTITSEHPSGNASLSVSGARDRRLNALVQFDSTDVFLVDTETPRVIASEPSNGASEIPATTSQVTLTFSEPIDPAVVTADNFLIRLGVSPLAQLTNPSYDADSRTVTMLPEGGLLPGSTYEVEVSAAVADLVGNRPDNVTIVRFSTRIPELLSTVPPDNEIGTSLEDGRLTATFDAPILTGLLVADPNAVQVLAEDDPQQLQETPVFSVESNTLSFSLVDGLKPGTRYEVVLASLLGGILRLQEGDYSWSFQTPVPDLVSSTPAEGDTTVLAATTAVVLQFDNPIDGSALTADEVSVLESGEERTLEALEYNPESLTVRIEVEGGLRAGSGYVVRLPRAIGGPQRDRPYSVRFSTAVPRVVSFSPDADAQEVSVELDEASVLFSVPIDADRLTADNFQLLRGAELLELRQGDPVDRGDGRYGLAPEAGWNAGSVYRVRIVRDVGGPLASGQPISWRFETAIPRVADVEPDSNAVDVAVSQVEATVQFTVPIDADQVVAENFSIAREGVNIPLRSGDPVDRGAGRYGFAPAGGWQVGSRYNIQIAPGVSGPLGPEIPVSWQFRTDVPDLSSVVPASGDTSIADLSIPVTAVFDSPLDETALLLPGNVSLLQQGTVVDLVGGGPAYNSNTNAVTIAPAGGLRAGTNYRARIASVAGGPLRQEVGDFAWEFSTRIPDIIRTVPGDAATITSGRDRVQVVLTGPISQDLITPQNLRLSQGGVPVALEAAAFGYDAATFTVLFPEIDFLSGNGYRAFVSSRLYGPLGAAQPDRQWDFRTQIPAVVSTRPASDEEGVSSTTPTIQLEFSGSVARQLQTDFQLLARALGDPLAAAQVVPITGFGADEGGTTISFAPEGGLNAFTEYQIEMAKEVLGQLAETGFSFRFRTAARLTNAALGGTITNPEGSVELYFPPNALEGGTSEVLIRPADDAPAKPTLQDSDLSRITRAFEISAPGATLRKPVTLTVAYSGDEAAVVQDPAKLAVFELAGGEWRRVGGVANASSREVITAVDVLGTFAVFQDLRTQVGKLAIRRLDCQPRAFAPRGGRFKRETDISFDLTGPANVTVRVYNTSGRLERVIVRDRALAPGRASFEWDGRDEDRNTVSSGLYIVVVNADDTRQEKVVAVVK
jgi:hypothetical protein